MTLTEHNFRSVRDGYAERPNILERVHRGYASVGSNKLRLIFRSTAVAFLLGILSLGMAACGPRRLNVMQTPEQTLVTVGYSADRSRSILRAENEAQEYCQRREATVILLKQDTLYQGHYDEEVTSAGRVAGRVADALGKSDAARASRALSSPTDYKTTLEFLCR